MATKQIGKTNPKRAIRHFAAGGVFDEQSHPELAAPANTEGIAAPSQFFGNDSQAGLENRLSYMQSLNFGNSVADATKAINSPKTTGIAQAAIEESLPTAPDNYQKFQYDSIRKPSALPTLGFAGGGKPDAEELMRQMSAKYGAPAAGPAQPANPQPAPVQQPQPKSGPATGLIGIIKGRQQQIDDAERKAVGYKNGKSPERNGFKIKGPGTPTSDSLAAMVRETGEPIKVSTEERIVSKAQEGLLQTVAKGLGFDSLDQLLEAGTGKPVGPTIKSGIAHAAFGKRPEDEAQPIQGIADLNESSLQDRQGAHMENNNLQSFQDIGAGIVKERGPSGKTSISNVGTQDIADMGKRAMDDSVSALIDQQNSTYNPARQLANMQRLRLETDANDPSITDPTVRDAARQQLNDSAARSAKQGEAYTRSLDNQLKQTKIVGEGQVASLQTQYLNERDPARRNEIAQQIRAIGGKGESGPSLGQQSNNLEIDAARKAIAGLTPEDIKRRTANYTATGRENLDFDPTLAHQMKLANSRKVGADDHFDQRFGEQTPKGNDDAATRFGSDPAMKSHRMGRVTDRGVEVFDATGKLIGHYR